MQMAKLDGMGSVACQSTGIPRDACSQNGQETPALCRPLTLARWGRKSRCNSAQRLQKGQGPCEIVPLCRTGGPNRGTQHPEPLWGLRATSPSLHGVGAASSMAEWGAGSPFPRPTADICQGAACVGRGHFQPRALLCFLHGKKLFPLLSAKLLAIIRQAGGKDSYPSNNAI